MQHLILTVLIMEEGILETDLVLIKFLGTLSFAILKVKSMYDILMPKINKKNESSKIRKIKTGCSSSRKKN